MVGGIRLVTGKKKQCAGKCNNSEEIFNFDLKAKQNSVRRKEKVKEILMISDLVEIYAANKECYIH